MKKRFYLFVILLMVLLVPALSSCRYINSLITIYNEASTTTKIPNKSITVNYYVDDTIYKTETIVLVLLPIILLSIHKSLVLILFLIKPKLII